MSMLTFVLCVVYTAAPHLRTHMNFLDVQASTYLPSHKSHVRCSLARTQLLPMPGCCCGTTATATWQPLLAPARQRCGGCSRAQQPQRPQRPPSLATCLLPPPAAHPRPPAPARCSSAPRLILCRTQERRRPGSSSSTSCARLNQFSPAAEAACGTSPTAHGIVIRIAWSEGLRPL